MKRQKTIAIALVTIGIIGGAFFLGNQESLNKIITKKTDLQTVKEKQLDYLKKHQDEIKNFIKSQNPKIESVQVDQNQTNWEEVGNGTPWGGGEVIRIFGGFNHIEDSSWSVLVDVENGKADIDSIMQGSPIRAGGEIFE